jgi:hypothetical protein
MSARNGELVPGPACLAPVPVHGFEALSAGTESFLHFRLHEAAAAG